MTKLPRISVILTSFNHEKYIREAIESVLNQTFTDFELIIWDDASQDNSWEAICSYSDPRIKTFRNDVQRRGIYGINKAITEVAQGEYIAIHHSDDVWEPEKLEKQVGFLKDHPDVGAIFTNVSIIDENSNPTTDSNIYSKVFEKKNQTRHGWLRQFFLQGNSLCHPSVLIRKEAYACCGLYRYGLAQVGDFDMWIRLCMKYEIHLTPEKLVKFRALNNNKNTSAIRPDSRRRIPVEYLMILDNYLNITNPEEVVQIFPECAQYVVNNEDDCEYLLARAALDTKPFGFTQLWGLKILFNIVNNFERASKIKMNHDFDYIDLINLTGQFDIFGYDEIDRLNTELERAAYNEVK